MVLELAKKEEEFLRKNETLEQETKQILEKLDEFRKNQEQSTVELVSNKSVNSVHSGIPQTVDQMGTKGMLHFYKSKLDVLQKNYEKVQAELKKKNDELQKLSKENHSLVEEKEKWFLHYHTEKNNYLKLEKEISMVHNKLQFKETTNLALQKEIEQLKNEIKSITSDLKACEGKIGRFNQENAKLKGTIQNIRQEEKEFKQSYKNEIKELTVNLKTLQKQKTDLINAYKKQLELIENLKNQKELLETLKVTELAEKEFIKVLELKK